MNDSRRRGAVLRNPIANLDWVLLSILLALFALGWVMIYAAGYGQGYPDGFGAWLGGTVVGKQTIFIGVCLLLLLCVLVVDAKFYHNGAYLIYGAGLLLLAGVIVFGKEVKGARSWYGIGGFSLQPSELAKFGAALGVASFLAAYRGQISGIRPWLTAGALMLAPSALIMLQPDAGSALVFLGLLLVMYRAGLNGNLFAFGFVVAALLTVGLVVSPSRMALALMGLGILTMTAHFERGRIYYVLAALALGTGVWYFLEQGGAWYLPVALAATVFLGLGAFWYSRRRVGLVAALTAFVFGGTALAGVANFLFNNALAPHQQDRLNVWLQPSKCDPRGSLYNVLQSKMAIGSGGWHGKGFLDGTLTKLRYVPEQTTDFIFCTVGEEHGFVGATLVIGLFVALLFRLVTLAERQRSLFATYYMYGIAGMLFTHFVLNIGMTMGLTPVIGIPLPFISYGGSSLISFTLIIGVALRLDATRAERV